MRQLISNHAGLRHSTSGPVTLGSNPILASQLTFSQSMLPTLIEITKLDAGKRNKQILHGIDWTLRQGEHWHLTGPSGAGKTTLLESLMGRTRVFGGRVSLPYLNNPDSHQERKSSMRLVSFTDTGKLFTSVNAVHYYQQRYNAFDSDGHLTVGAYLAEGGLDPLNKAHQDLIDQFELRSLLHTERIKLSSGQTRKLILCKAFLEKPAILLLDNPHIGLDNESRDQFNNLVDQMAHKHQTTFILSGQFRSLPRCISHQLTLEKGSVKSKGVGQLSVLTRSRPALNVPQKYALDKIRYYYLTAPSSPDTAPVLSFKNTQISYAGKQIIDPVNWQVQRGEKWCIVGANGSGKSTLVGLIYGDHPQAYRNDIEIFGKRRGQGESIWDIKQRMGFTSPELHAYFPSSLNATEVIISGFSDTLYPKQITAKEAELTGIFLSYFDLANIGERPWMQLSTGEQRLVLFIRALIKAPALLLLDEPFQGMDPEYVQLCKLLLNEVLTPSHSLIFITHFRDEIPLTVTKELNL